MIRPALLILVPALAFPIMSYRIIMGDSMANAALASADAVVAPVPDAPSFGMGDEATYSLILERPIFSPSRHPLASHKAHASAEDASGLSLLGVVSRAGRAIALIRTGAAGPAIKAEQGQEVAGWQLTTVRPAEVLLERQGGRLELKLPFKAAAPLSAPVIALPQPQAAPGQQPAAGQQPLSPQQAPAAQQPAQAPGQPQPAAAGGPPPSQPSAQEIQADQEPS